MQIWLIEQFRRMSNCRVFLSVLNAMFEVTESDVLTLRHCMFKLL